MPEQLATIAVPATRVGGYSPLKALAAAQTNVEADRKERDRVAEEQDRAMIQSVMQQTPEDPDTAIKTLKQRGFFGAATLLQKTVTEERTKMAAQRKGEIDNEIQTTKLVSDIFGGASTPEDLQTAWSVAQARMVGLDPKVDAIIKRPFNEAVARQLMNGARTEEERLKALKLAIERKDLDAWRAAMAADPEGVEAEQAGNMLMGPQVIATLKGQAEGREIQREGQQVTMRGQDIGAATAEANRGVTMRGQDIGASTAAANRAAANARAANALAAQKAGGAGGNEARGLAEMAAKSPSVLQGLTPTVIGQAMNVIANDPELRTQFENARMAPIRGRSQNILTALDNLITTGPDKKPRLTPGAKQIFGAFTPVSARGMIPGQAATDANAALQQVLGQQIVELIADMKSQSKTGATGFGQLNVRELNVLESAATQLTQRMSEPAALRELLSLREKLQKVMQPSSGTGGSKMTAEELIQKYGAK